tara:strand:- start:12411 stop:16610 length:4200 start_codon:yes stop_codon:yes gene_type:complete
MSEPTANRFSAPAIMRGMVKSIVAVIAGVVVVIALTVGLLQFSSLRQSVLSFALSAVNSGDTKISIGDIDGSWPRHLHVTDVRIADVAGDWLTLDEADVVWSPLSLLRAHVEIETLDARGLNVLRAPVSAAEDDTSSGLSLELPVLPVSVRLNAINLRDITVARALAKAGAAGELATLTLTGSAALDRSTLALSLIAERSDDVTGHYKIDTVFSPRNRHLTLDLAVQDGDAQHAGLVHAFGVSDLPVVKLSASASTDGEAVAGRMNLDGGNALAVALDGTGTWSRDLDLKLDAQASGRLIAEALKDSIDASALTLATDVHWSGKDVLSVENLELRAGALSLDGRAALASVSRAMPHPFTASGTIKGADVLADAKGAAALSEIAFDMAAFIDMRNNMAEISDLTLTSVAGKAQYAGAFALDGSTFKGDVDASLSDLAALDGLTGRTLGGTATLRLSPFAMSDKSDIAGDFTLRTTGITTGDPALDAFIGNVSADGSLLVLGKGGYALPSFAVTPQSGAYKLSGNVGSSAGGNLTGEAHFETREIAALLPRGEASGAVKADVTLTGTMEAPAGHLVATLDKGSVSGVATESLSADIHAVPGGTGALVLRYKGAPGSAAIDAQLTLPSEGGVKLDSIDGAIFGGKLTGYASVDNSGEITSAIRGEHINLTSVGDFTGLPVSGVGDLDFAMTPAGGKQAASLVFKAPRIDAGGVTFDRTELNIQMSDLFGTPVMDAGFYAAAGQFALTHLSGVNLKAKGPLDTLAFDANILGTHEDALPKAFALTTQGVVRSKGATSIDLQTFNLTLGTATAALAKPVAIRLENGLSAKGIAIDMTGATGAGQIAGDVAIASTAQMKLRFSNMPLDFSTLFLPAGSVEGSLSGTLDLDAARNKGNARLNFKDIRVAQDVDDPRPAFDASVTGDWAGARLELVAAAQGISEKPFDLKASLPVVRPKGSAFPTLATRGKVSGSLDWDGPLASLAALVELNGQRVAGRARVNLRASGDISAPVIDGSATLSNGEYENFSTGTVLKSIEARLEAQNSRDAGFTLTATDGASGRINAKGSLTLDKNAADAISISAEVSNARLLRRADVDATIDGNILLRGPALPPTLEEPAMLSGALTTKEMVIHIPDSLPADVPLVEVIEINGGATASATPMDQKAEPLPLLLDLTLATTKPVRVTGRGLDSLWAGNFAVTGSIDEPLVKGVLNSQRGTLDFAGKTFTLTKGNVTFPGTYPVEPNFAVVLTYKRNDFTATINVSGSSTKPVITFSSSPSLPKDEILAHILFDKGVGELSALETLQLARTLAELSGVNIGGTGGGIMDRVQETLSLDVLRIDSGASGATTVSAGKYIQEGIYVGVEQGALASDSSVKVEIEVTPQISIETRVGQNASSEVGVNWKWDY